MPIAGYDFNSSFIKKINIFPLITCDERPISDPRINIRSPNTWFEISFANNDLIHYSFLVTESNNNIAIINRQ